MSTAVYLHLAQQNAQLGQLQRLNYQMWQQQAEEQRQRYLSDVLLGVTQATERIHLTAGKDHLAAGILAHRWLQTTHWVNASLFSDFERKRTWEQCRTILTHSRERLYADHHAAQIANAYLRIEDRIIELQALLGRDPKATVQHWQKQTRDAELYGKIYGIAAAIIAGLAVMLSVPSIALNDSGGAFALLFLIWIVAGPLSLALANAWWGKSKVQRRATFMAHQTASAYVELEQLFTSENGQRFLERTRAEHPLLVYAPGPEPARSQNGTHTHEKETIERQVVVGRCKFCAALTPVDLSRCKNCGADKPI